MATQQNRTGGNGGRSDEFLRAHRLLETKDLDRAREFVSGIWERHSSVILRGRTYSILWNEAQLNKASVSCFESPTRIRVECAPLTDFYRVMLHETGGMTHWVNGYKTVATPATSAIHAPGQELRLDPEPYRALMLSFEGATVRDALTERLGWVPSSEQLARELVLDSPAGASLRTLLRWTATELDQPGRGVLASAAAVDNLEGTLLTLFLDCLINPFDKPKRRIEEATVARVNRVEDWIDAHLGDAIRIDDLARVANASVRALENAFRRYRDCTPMEAVTRRRLVWVREMLLRAPPGATVTSVATEAGFFHLGRFAALYREAFGESPSATLRSLRQ